MGLFVINPFAGAEVSEGYDVSWGDRRQDTHWIRGSGAATGYHPTNVAEPQSGSLKIPAATLDRAEELFKKINAFIPGGN